MPQQWLLPDCWKRHSRFQQSHSQTLSFAWGRAESLGINLGSNCVTKSLTHDFNTTFVTSIACHGTRPAYVAASTSYLQWYDCPLNTYWMCEDSAWQNGHFWVHVSLDKIEYNKFPYWFCVVILKVTTTTVNNYYCQQLPVLLSITTTPTVNNYYSYCQQLLLSTTTTVNNYYCLKLWCYLFSSQSWHNLALHGSNWQHVDLFEFQVTIEVHVGLHHSLPTICPSSVLLYSRKFCGYFNLVNWRIFY